MAVPYTFGNATTSIPLSQLDSNFATAITLGNTSVQLGNTITNLTGVTNIASASSLTVGSNGNTTAITVDTSQNSTFAGTVNMSSSFLRNRIINGNMQVWQRGTSGFTSVNYGGAYTADRFWIAGGSSTNITASQVSSIGLAGYQYALRTQRNSGNTGTSSVGCGQIIESVNMFDLAGQSVTLSFWARAGANYSGASNVLYVYSRTGTVADQGLQSMIGSTWTGIVVNTIASVTLTTSWQKFTATFTVPSNALELDVDFGYTATGTAGTNDYFDITGVQLEVGTIATPFERPLYSKQLADCQRYYQTIGGSFNGSPTYQQYSSGCLIISSTAVYATLYTIGTMRSTPTLTLTNTSNFIVFDGSVSNTLTSYSLDFGSPNTVGIVLGASAGGLTVGRSARFFQNASNATQISFSAEL